MIDNQEDIEKEEKEFERQKADKTTYYNRVRSVQEWLLQGFNSSDICQNMSVNWGITERQAYRYLKEARKLFVEQNETEFEEKKSFHLNARLSLYKEAVKQSDKYYKKLALEILKDMADIEGLYVQKVEHSGKIDGNHKHEVIFKKMDNDKSDL